MSATPQTRSRAEPLMANTNDTEARDSGDPDEPPDEAPFEKTYLAIDGIAADDFTESEQGSIERKVAEFMLTQLGKPISNVRLLEDGEGVIEFETDA